MSGQDCAELLCSVLPYLNLCRRSVTISTTALQLPHILILNPWRIKHSLSWEHQTISHPRAGLGFSVTRSLYSAHACRDSYPAMPINVFVNIQEFMSEHQVSFNQDLLPFHFASEADKWAW